MSALGSAAVAALALPPAAAGAGVQAGVQAGYGVSLTDLSSFNQALAGAAQRLESQPVNPTGEALKTLMQPLEQINTEAAQLSQHAQRAMDSGNSLSPGEMVMLSVKCHEFLFHSQLTANVANRTSDGLQQLFRQQA
jgi:hypothetical protein